MDKFFKFLNSDRYQYTESEIYLKNNMQNQTAVFDVFLRTEKENDYAVVYGISNIAQLEALMPDYRRTKRHFFYSSCGSFPSGNYRCYPENPRTQHSVF